MNPAKQDDDLLCRLMHLQPPGTCKCERHDGSVTRLIAAICIQVQSSEKLKAETYCNELCGDIYAQSMGGQGSHLTSSSCELGVQTTCCGRDSLGAINSQ